MRIVFVIPSLGYGGAETQTISLARALAARGHDVAILTLRNRNPRAHELDGTGVTIVPEEKRWKLDIGMLRRLRRYIVEFRADIVQGILMDGDFCARLAAAGTGIPTLNSERNDNYVVPFFHRIGLLFANRLIVGVVANSHAGARFAEKRFRVPTANVHTVWNGIDLAKIDSSTRSGPLSPKLEFFGTEDVKVACLVGAIKPQKDYLLAVEVADVLTRADPTWRVLFVGERLHHMGPGYESDVLNAHKRLGLDGRAKFAGLRTDVVSIMSQCDVLFSTSLYEGFPNAVMEAMAAGTPVVSTDYSDIRLILPNAWQVVGNRSANELAEAIQHAYRERNKVIEQQRDWVERNATMAIAADRLEAIYAKYCKTLQGERSRAQKHV